MVGELRLRVQAPAGVVEIDLAFSVQASVLGRPEPVETGGVELGCRRRNAANARSLLEQARTGSVSVPARVQRELSRFAPSALPDGVDPSVVPPASPGPVVGPGEACRRLRSVLEQQVVARAAVEGVLTGAAAEEVVTLAAEQGVVSGAPNEDVVICPPSSVSATEVDLSGDALTRSSPANALIVSVSLAGSALSMLTVAASPVTRAVPFRPLTLIASLRFVPVTITWSGWPSPARARPRRRGRT